MDYDLGKRGGERKGKSRKEKGSFSFPSTQEGKGGSRRRCVSSGPWGKGARIRAREGGFLTTFEGGEKKRKGKKPPFSIWRLKEGGEETEKGIRSRPCPWTRAEIQREL